MEKIVIGYCRISEEDERDKISSSIHSQKKIIETFCAENNLANPKCFMDDGVNGVSIQRPALSDCLRLCEEDNVSAVIVKDLSRLGRNYKACGEMCHFFAKKGIRFIAILDGIDSAKGESDLFPYLSILNELHSRDLSRKILSAKRQLQEKGLYSGRIPPYGYKLSEDDRHKLVIDELSSVVVQKIFLLSASGIGTNRICKILMNEKIPSPFAYFRTRGHLLDESEDDYYWHPFVVRSILRNPVYLGKLVFGRNARSRFLPAPRPTPLEKCTIKDNTHPPIIDLSLFEMVAAHWLEKHESPNRVQKYFLSGKIRCGICKRIMYYSRERGSYHCESRRLRGSAFCDNTGVSEENILSALSTSAVKIFLKAQINSLKNPVCLSERIQYELAKKRFEIQLENVYSNHRTDRIIDEHSLYQFEEFSSEYETLKNEYYHHLDVQSKLLGFYKNAMNYGILRFEEFVFDMVDYVDLSYGKIKILYKEVDFLD